MTMIGNGSKPMHCLTFDVEEHFQVSAFESPMRRRHWDQFASRVERNTDKVLDIIQVILQFHMGIFR